MRGLIASLLYFLMIFVPLAIITYLGVRYGINKVDDDFNRMNPTLPPGKLYIIDRTVRKPDALQPGDLIMFHRPNEEKIPNVVARVIAKPGSVVKIENGRAFVNDVALPDLGVRADLEPLGSMIVPTGHVCILYDNQKTGRPPFPEMLVHERLILGKVVWK